MVGELIEWFTIAADDEYGGTRCHEILESIPTEVCAASLLSIPIRSVWKSS